MQSPRCRFGSVLRLSISGLIIALPLPNLASPFLTNLCHLDSMLRHYHSMIRFSFACKRISLPLQIPSWLCRFVASHGSALLCHLYASSLGSIPCRYGYSHSIAMPCSSIAQLFHASPLRIRYMPRPAMPFLVPYVQCLLASLVRFAS